MNELKIPKDIQDRINSVNQSLIALDSLKDYAPDNFKSMKNN